MRGEEDLSQRSQRLGLAEQIVHGMLDCGHLVQKNIWIPLLYDCSRHAQKGIRNGNKVRVRFLSVVSIDFLRK